MKVIPERGTSKYIHYTWSSNKGVDLAAEAGTHPVVINVSGFPRAIKVISFRMKCNTAPTGQDIIADMNINGTTIWTTQANRPKIVATQFDSGQKKDMEVTALVNGDELKFDLDQVGSVVAGQDLEADLEVEVQY